VYLNECVEDVFQLYGGGVTMVLGPPGCGKTLLIKNVLEKHALNTPYTYINIRPEFEIPRAHSEVYNPQDDHLRRYGLIPTQIDRSVFHGQNLHIYTEVTNIPHVGVSPMGIYTKEVINYIHENILLKRTSSSPHHLFIIDDCASLIDRHVFSQWCKGVAVAANVTIVVIAQNIHQLWPIESREDTPLIDNCNILHIDINNSVYSRDDFFLTHHLKTYSKYFQVLWEYKGENRPSFMYYPKKDTKKTLSP